MLTQSASIITVQAMIEHIFRWWYKAYYHAAHPLLQIAYLSNEIFVRAANARYLHRYYIMHFQSTTCGVAHLCNSTAVNSSLPDTLAGESMRFSRFYCNIREMSPCRKWRRMDWSDGWKRGAHTSNILSCEREESVFKLYFTKYVEVIPHVKWDGYVS